MIYEFRCESTGVVITRRRYMADRNDPAECRCGAHAGRIVSRPRVMVSQPDLDYDCPVTGEPVSSWKKRKEIFAKHDLCDAREVNSELRKKRLAKMAAQAEGTAKKQLSQKEQLDAMIHDAREEARHY